VPVTGSDVIKGESYSHAVPIGKAMEEDTLLVWEMNGEPIPIDHGFPFRAFFSGWGANSNVKWVESIAVSDAEKMVLPPLQKNQDWTGIRRSRWIPPARGRSCSAGARGRVRARSGGSR
jgi:DMSO/TMAO reductase YedYZ molybdopterin-dependent catalytic subunit